MSVNVRRHGWAALRREFLRPASVTERRYRVPSTGTCRDGVWGACRATSSLQCGYNECMNMATSSSEVGIRELKNGLSGYIDRVRNGEEVIVTDRGRPVARLSALDADHDHLAELIATGIVRAPTSSKRRHVPKHRIKSKGTVSDLVAEQRR